MNNENNEKNSSLPKEKKSNVAIVGGTHGNEYTGIWCIKSLEKKLSTNMKNDSSLSLLFPSLNITTLLANPKAYQQNKRFVDRDLNRSFRKETLMDTTEKNWEFIRAKEINTLLGPKFIKEGEEDIKLNPNPNTDVIIDLHTTTSNMGITLIINEGDVLMAQAASYVMYKCNHTNNNDGASSVTNHNKEESSSSSLPVVRCLMHRIPNRGDRPNLSSIAKHGFTIEVGPVPQGIIRHDAVEYTDMVIMHVLEFLHRNNNNHSNNNDEEKRTTKKQKVTATTAVTTTTTKVETEETVKTQEADERNNNVKTIQDTLREIYVKKDGNSNSTNNRYLVPCYRSVKAKRNGEMSAKICWESISDNPNFPSVMVHRNLQDRDYYPIRKGDPMFVALDGTIIPYDGTYGDEICLMFINEGGYYYESSGTGISITERTYFDFNTGQFIE